MDVDNWGVVKRGRRNKTIRFLIILDLWEGGSCFRRLGDYEGEVVVVVFEGEGVSR